MDQKTDIEERNIRIAVVDDHRVVLEGLKRMLSGREAFEIALESTSAEDLLQRLPQSQIDVILLDVNLPGINGVEACKKIKRIAPDVHILILSMLNEISLVKMAVRNGASGYLLKNSGPREVAEAILAVWAGKRYYSEEILDGLLEQSPQNTTQLDSPFPKLSRREKQVLQLIVDEYTTSEIAEKLFISFTTVETHRRNLLIKLGARNTAGLVRLALEYRLLEDR